MADQFNDSIPSVTNQITEDVADIAESLGFLKDCFQKILGATWSNTDTTGFKLLSTIPFNDGTYNYTIPTQPAAGLAHAKFMLGTSSTIIWMYLNTAPPGWKALSTGADNILAIAGGSVAYNVNGGNQDSVAAWDISGLTADAHTHTGPSHTHTGTTDTGLHWSAGTEAGVSGAAANTQHDHAFTTAAGGTGATAAASANTVTSAGTWRPKASVGKLFQLDTA
jgi:hypothetical protein